MVGIFIYFFAKNSMVHWGNTLFFTSYKFIVEYGTPSYRDFLFTSIVETYTTFCFYYKFMLVNLYY
jgi:hypothetical protein